MSRIFFKFLKNKSFIISLILFISIIFIAFRLMLTVKLNYMENAHIISDIYLINTFFTPSTFFENGYIIYPAIDLCFFCILLYIVVQIIHFFLETSPSTTLLRIGRKKWLNKIFIINIIYSLLITIIYVSIITYLFLNRNVNTLFHISNLTSIGMKFLFSVFATEVYLFIYLKLSNIFYAILSALSAYFGGALLLRMFLVSDFKNNIYQNAWILALIISLLILIVYILSKKEIIENDI